MALAYVDLAEDDALPRSTSDVAVPDGTGDAPASAGSVGHPNSCGLPCKYFWKPRGCKDAAKCKRCHLCRWQPVLGRNAAAPKKDGESSSSQQAKAKAKDSVVTVVSAVTALSGLPKNARDERLTANAAIYKNLSDEELKAKVPRREDGSLTSLGTFLHASGLCIRCQYAFTPEGCPAGLRCKFCHERHPRAEAHSSKDQKRAWQDDSDDERKPKRARGSCDENGNSRPSWLQDDDDLDLAASRFRPHWAPPPHWGGASPPQGLGYGCLTPVPPPGYGAPPVAQHMYPTHGYGQPPMQIGYGAAPGYGYAALYPPPDPRSRPG